MTSTQAITLPLSGSPEDYMLAISTAISAAQLRGDIFGAHALAGLMTHIRPTPVSTDHAQYIGFRP